MWHPPERIFHPLPDPGWPTAEEAGRARLYQPIAVGPATLRQRTWVPAMVPWRATDDGFVTEDVLAWYERFAHGRPGALVVEATGIRDIPSGPLLRIGHDKFISGLNRLVDTVRRASGGETRLLIQIIDFLRIRRRPSREAFLGRFLQVAPRHREVLELPADAPDAVVRGRLAALPEEDLVALLLQREKEDYLYGARERVTDVHLPHVRDLPRELPGIFAGAAHRAAAAGFDGVELHFAHAYTIASFLSARNDRADGYGGPREHRVRLPLEVYRAVRASVQDRIVVGCRLLSEECIDGGSTREDGVFFAVALAREGIDYLSLSRGGKFEDAKVPAVGSAAYPYTGPSGYECMPSTISDAAGPFGRNLVAAGAIRGAVRAAGLATPIIVAGGISGFAQAEAALRAGQADIVAAARQSLADPDWFAKVRAGRGADVRRCTFTNYCEGLDQMHKQVTCKLWDRVGLQDPAVKRTADGRRRLTAP